MAQLTPMGLIRILGQVTLIMLVPMVGGAVAGLVLDAILGTSPICVLSGFVVGNVVAIIGIWLYIRSRAPRYRVTRQESAGADRADDV
jgi:hypothetical protein